MAATIETIETLEQATGKYKYGFVTDIDSDKAPKGLNEDIIRFISAKKDEPEWMLEWRLKAFATWKKMDSPDWAKLDIPPIDYQDAYYYAAPKSSDGPASLDEVDPELLRTYEKLGIPISEQKLLAGVVAVDAVFDSVSVATTCRDELAKAVDAQMNSGVTTFIEVMLNQELGEPFRRDAMKKPVSVAGIDRNDMRPQTSA